MFNDIIHYTINFVECFKKLLLQRRLCCSILLSKDKKGGKSMKNLLSKIKLEKADYRKIKEIFEDFMFETTSSIEDSMIKQIPEQSSRSLIKPAISLSTTLKTLLTAAILICFSNISILWKRCPLWKWKFIFVWE